MTVDNYKHSSDMICCKFKRIILAIALRRNERGATQKKSYSKRIITKLQDKNDGMMVQGGSIECDGCYLDISRYSLPIFLNSNINYYISTILKRNHIYVIGLYFYFPKFLQKSSSV